MKYDIVIVPNVKVGYACVCDVYKTLKGACQAQGVSYNTVTSYFRLNPSKDSYTHKKTGTTFVKAKLL